MGGRFRGFRLETRKGDAVRPTADRAKEALFSILAPRLPEARVVDCFAGTGSLGIEALSRGASRVVFVERDPRTLEILRRNLGRLPEPGEVKVVEGDALRPAGWAKQASPADVVLADPPFHLDLAAAFLEALASVDVLAGDGVLVVEHEATTRPGHPAWETIQERCYGSIAFTFLRRSGSRARG